MNPLARYQTDNKLTQMQLALVLGMPQSQVSRLRSGDRRPTLDTMVRIERATGITLAEWAAWAGADVQEAGAA